MINQIITKKNIIKQKKINITTFKHEIQNGNDYYF